MDIDQGEIGDADRPFYGVAVGFAKGFHLFQVNAFEAGQFFQDAVGGLVEAFFGLQEAAHQAPVAFFGFEPSLDQQQFDILAIESENDTVDGYERAGFTRVSIHVW